MKILYAIMTFLIFFGPWKVNAAIEVITKPVPKVLNQFCYELFNDLKKSPPLFKPLFILTMAKGLIPEMRGGDGDGEKYEIRRFGIHENLAYEIVTLVADSFYKPHRHPVSHGYFYIAKGTGIMTLNTKGFRYGPGDQFEVAPGLLHGFKTETKTVFLSINDPPIFDVHTGKVDIEF